MYHVCGPVHRERVPIAARFRPDYVVSHNRVHNALPATCSRQPGSNHRVRTRQKVLDQHGSSRQKNAHQRNVLVLLPERSQHFIVELGEICLESPQLSSRSIRVAGGIVETSPGVFGFAVGDIDVASGLCIGEFSESADDEGVPRVEVLALELEVADELRPFLLDGELVVNVGVVGVDELEVVPALQRPQRVQNRRSVRPCLQITSPELVALNSLPPHCPPSALHADVVEIPEQLNPSQPVDVVDLLANQHYVFNRREKSSRGKSVRVLEQNQRLPYRAQTVLVLVSR